MNASDLWAEFRENRSEQAFGELVRRYTNLVYSVARRRLANGSLAEEITQTVFLRLAKAVPQFRGDAELVAWLHRTTTHASIDLWRVESRRQIREQQAAVMQLDADENVAWNELAPVLDQALNELTDADRQTILLRFFERKTMRDLGAVLGVSEDAAKMRVSRALERLRTQLSAHGTTCGVAALGTLLSSRAVEAAPVALLATLMCLSLPVPVGVGTSSGFFGSLLHFSHAKLIVGLTSTILVGTTALMLFRVMDQGRAPVLLETSQSNAPGVIQDDSGATAFADLNAMDAGAPDPRKLLQGVAGARRRISSGSMELDLSTDQVEAGRTKTRQRRIAIQFDGPKLRFESFAREYSYTVLGSDESPEAREAVRRADSMESEEAVRAGLLQGFEAHVVMASDGVTLVRFRESDGTGGSTVVDDAREGSAGGEYFFDPRCLGLRSSLSFRGTMESYLGYPEAKAVSLMGEQTVEGVATWHVRVQTKYEGLLDFWIDKARPDRLIKQSEGSDFVVSKYSDANPRDPFPIEVTTTKSYSNEGRKFITRFVRSNTQLNVAVDPVSFTLAGLGMPVGTSVSDTRISRSLGYWTGAGLSDNPPKKGGKIPPAPNRDELLALLDQSPASSEALEAAIWILLNTPDGPEVEKAGRVVLQEHIQDPGLAELCQKLERLRHRCATNLLEAMLRENPNPEVKANACFYLATLWKQAASFGQNKKATTEAATLFERVITEFGQVGRTGAELARKAKPELYELRHLILGKPAPETAGEDLDGQRLSLADYRGQVVVLFFWCCEYTEASEHRKLIERLAGKPVTFIGVSGDNQLSDATAAVNKQQVFWPCIWDGRDGSFREAWNVSKYLSTFVLDRKGVIRYREVRGPNLAEAVETLLKE
jgi:RNA polymerase sigma factor (sigma-70 family)